MTAWEPLRRRVYVLGKEALMDDLHAVAERAELDGVPLVLFSLGYPVSTAQERIMDEALKLVGEMRLQLEMELVARMEELPDLLADGDEVAVLSSGFEHLRLEWLLRERLEQREHASLF